MKMCCVELSSPWVCLTRPEMKIEWKQPNPQRSGSRPEVRPKRQQFGMGRYGKSAGSDFEPEGTRLCTAKIEPDSI